MTRVLVCVFMVALLAGQASADYLDLMTRGATGTINGATFTQIDPDPVGTGVFKPFLRVRMTGNEQGYNTNAPAQSVFDDQPGLQWTHALQVSSMPTITIGTRQYWEFRLDINEQKDGTQALLSLNDIEIYRGSAVLANYAGTPVDASGHAVLGPSLAALGATLVYDLDGAGDTGINLNYALNRGSGWGDMSALIPVSGAGDYLLLYSHFGNPPGQYASGCGFEEWASDPLTDSTKVPVPAAVILGMLGMGTAGWSLRRFV